MFFGILFTLFLRKLVTCFRQIIHLNLVHHSVGLGYYSAVLVYYLVVFLKITVESCHGILFSAFLLINIPIGILSSRPWLTFAYRAKIRQIKRDNTQFYNFTEGRSWVYLLPEFVVQTIRPCTSLCCSSGYSCFLRKETKAEKKEPTGSADRSTTTTTTYRNAEKFLNPVCTRIFRCFSYQITLRMFLQLTLEQPTRSARPLTALKMYNTMGYSIHGHIWS